MSRNSGNFLQLAKTLGAESVYNSPLAKSPFGLQYLTEKQRSQDAEDLLNSAQTPVGAISGGIALYIQRKRENEKLAQLNEQFQAENMARSERRGALINSLPEDVRPIADFINDDEKLAEFASKRLQGATPENTLNLENKRLQNIKLNKEINQVGKPNQDKAPSGYRFNDVGDLEAIAGGPATKQSAESAGKIALIKQGLGDISSFENQIKDKDGSFNRTKIAGLRTYGRPNARDEYSKLFNSLNSRLRLESGAAVPETEVKRAFETFAPSPLDSDATIQSKISRMKDYFASAEKEIGQGRGAEPIAPIKSNSNTFQSSNGVKFTIKR
jgi:hypothetical protein